MKFSILKTKGFLFLTTVLFSVFWVGSINAQTGTSGVSGTVNDQTGAVVPGATVNLTNPATGFNRSVTTDSDGKFSFLGIPPATYNVEIKATNFKTLVNKNVQALVDSPISIPAVLEPGDVSVVVDVTSSGAESIKNDQDASIGNNFVPQQITQLPTDLRRVADLLTLQPAVTREGYVAGGRSDQANILLDGIDINDQQNGGRTSQFQTTQDTVLRATTESVEEFRITTTNANANQGRSSGAQISLITRRGTNSFNGAAYYFYRPTAFSANDFFNNLAGVERPSLARDVFGGRIGGPIIKDRFFFFYAFEGQREQQDVSVVREVPLANLGQGVLRFQGAAPGDAPGTNRVVSVTTAQLNQIYSVVGINPLAVSVLGAAAGRYAANDTSVGDGFNVGGFRFNSSTSTEENTHIARFDYRLTNSQQLYFRGNYQYDILKGTSQFPDTPAGALWAHPYGFVVGHDWLINSNMTNNMRYGLTRQSFSTQGDSDTPSISFRFVYSPLAFARTLSRVTPTQNITDDFTWIKGDHTFQFGGNVRIIRNKRVDYASAYDDAITNPSFYQGSGRILDQAFTAAGYTVPTSSRTTIQNAATALIGRYSQYSGNFTYDLDGSVLDPGTPTLRNFATEEYDTYFQDIWKPYRNLTLTLGMRYGLSRPVYEGNGFQVVPTERLGDFFERRKAAALQGRALNDLISFEKAGPANNGQGFYSMDWDNWQPRAAFAWSPNFGNKFLKGLFGKENEAVIRGGFAITNDHFGEQLAVSFDGLSSIGFTSSTTIAANTYNITNNPAPRFTGFNQNIRSLPGIPAPVQRFATEVTPECLSGAEWCPQRIESSLDGTIKTPTHYSWNLSYGRELPFGMYFEASYIGRKARNLLGSRDVMALNNLVDTRTGMDWYTAAGMLHDARAGNVPFDSPSLNIPYFTNIFGNQLGAKVANIVEREFGFFDDTFLSLNPTQVVMYLASRDGYNIANDWTFIQLILDDAGPTPNLFYHPQYAAFSSFGSFAKSDYNGASFTLRQRLGDTLSFDINYTWSKSFDDVSGLQTGTSYGSQFLLNPLRPQDQYGFSDFDTRHVLNANFIFKLPVGRGQTWFSNMGKITDAFVGGWQLAGIFRWNTGQPLISPFDAAQWATNWNAQSAGTRIRPVNAGVVRSTQNVFSDPQAAFNSFRNARPGETGERNVIRGPGYSSLDLGLSKTWTMPWNEKHKFEFRVEAFNVTNVQYFDGQNGNFTRTTFGLPQDPELCTQQNDCEVSPDFGKIYTSIQGSPRSFQFGVRYQF
ncbi:MAG TPA: TonB-dependent receptor [Pyrinomonadaceae bacterium]